MREKPKELVEKFRVYRGSHSSPPGKTYGAFFIQYKSFRLKVIASDGEESGWDHVSVSLEHRCPNWDEMCFVKDLFFDEGETVVQFHPAKSDYINNHKYCLHMWRPVDLPLPLPDQIMV